MCRVSPLNIEEKLSITSIVLVRLSRNEIQLSDLPMKKTPTLCSNQCDMFQKPTFYDYFHSFESLNTHLNVIDHFYHQNLKVPCYSDAACVAVSELCILVSNLLLLFYVHILQPIYLYLQSHAYTNCFNIHVSIPYCSIICHSRHVFDG